MPFAYDAKGTKPKAGKDFSPVPPGRYLLKIKKAVSKRSSKGNPMVECTCEIEDSAYLGKTIMYYVTFLEPGNDGAGLTLHFLKCIGEPFEGAFNVDEKNWIGKLFIAKVGQKEHNQNIYNNILVIEPGPSAPPQVQKEFAMAGAQTENVPF